MRPPPTALRWPRRRLLHAGLASGLALCLGPVRACEFWSSNLRIIHPWTRASRDGATTAVVCMRFDDVAHDDRLLGVSTPVASGAQMGGLDARDRVDFAIPQGRESQLSEAGTFVRLLGLTQPLEVGRAYPMQLIFERGGAVNTDLTVDYERFR